MAQANEIFITYSRRNKQFVARIVEVMKASGVDPWFDKEDIPSAAEWWPEIQRGIAGANAYVFIVTPDSLRSEVSHWELDYAFTNGKKVIPVLHIDVFGDADLMTELETMTWVTPEGKTVNVGQNWNRMRRINFVLLQDEADLETGVAEILKTAHTDLAYLQDHTRLLERALEWDERKRDRSYLLFGHEVEQAELWLQNGSTKDPRPTELHVEYISTSWKNRRRRMRFQTITAVVTALFIFVLFIASVVLGLEAQSERVQARENLLDAWNIQTLFLADLSEEAHRNHKPQTALLLALETLRYREEGIYNVEGQVALTRALSSPVQEVLFLPHDDALVRAAWNSEETYILTHSWSDVAQLQVWDATTGALFRTLPHDERVIGAVWNPVDDRVLTWDTQPRIWSMGDDPAPLVFPHESVVSTAVWSPDGTRLLTLDGENVVRVWAAEDGTTPLAELAHETSLSGAVWSPDGTQIVTWGADNIVRIWPLAGDEPLAYPHDDRVRDVTWDADGMRVLVRVSGNSAWLWPALESGDPLQLIHDGDVRGAAWSPDGTRILTRTSSNEAYLWTPDSDDAPLTLRHPDNVVVNGARWSPEGDYVLTWASNNRAQVWDAATGDALGSYAHENVIIDGVWSDDSRRVVSWAAEQEPAAVWNPLTGEEEVVFYHEVISQADWNDAGDRVMTLSSDDTVRVWNPAARHEPRAVRHEDAINGAQWNGDETRLLTWSDDMTVRIWPLADAGRPTTLAHDGAVTLAAWSPDETLILTTAGAEMAIWTVDGEQVQTMTHPAEILGAAWDGTGQRVLLWSEGVVAVWDVTAEEEMLTINGASQAAWTPDAAQVLAWGPDGQVQVWDVVAGERLLSVRHDDAVLGAALNGTALLTWALDGTARLWDAATGEQTFIARYDDAVVLGAAWNAAGDRLLVWTDGGTVEVWDISAGEVVITLPHDAAVTSAAWNTPETHILTRSEEFTALVWTMAGEVVGDVDEAIVARWNQAGDRVLATTLNNTVDIWDLNERDLLVSVPLGGSVNGASWNQAETRVLAIVGPRVTIWTASLDDLVTLAEQVAVRDLTVNEREDAFLLEINNR